MVVQERVDNRKTPYNTVKLLTSTIKSGADEEGLRYCFRVVSPEKIYLLQVSCSTSSIMPLPSCKPLAASLWLQAFGCKPLAADFDLRKQFI